MSEIDWDSVDKKIKRFSLENERKLENVSTFMMEIQFKLCFLYRQNCFVGRVDYQELTHQK